MDAIDILGGLLKKKSSGSGSGADILKDMFGRGSRPKPQPKTPQRRTTESIEEQAKDLEDMLNVAHGRTSSGGGTSSRRSPSAPQSTSRTQIEPGGPLSPDFGSASFGNEDRIDEQQRAMILIQAMVNAAKSDGQVSREEQQSILSHLDRPDQETIDFLRAEFNKPLDVREFAWSVPIGLEQEVYSLSLIVVDLASERESKYLQDLAHGLRLSSSTCEQIRRQIQRR
ncbi:hypothetical protein KOR42_07420 [Thalassoglobus neptunius]|uniref:Inner membrane protein YebE n=1 Tax=Thalassoglobus neptunius TaxID=1938619 RepID=A0A5C5X5V1_9PLAN|nr:DUF533 domain-containing protein [Thalassoglobus neptunius]TWT57382.1 hypothetical protein KOR42_07420 [Thalassoglobus neptunius]